MPKISHDIPLYFISRHSTVLLYFALSLCIPILLVEPPIFSQFQTYMMWVKQTKPSIYSENFTLKREKPPSKGKKTCRRPNKQNGSKWMVFLWFTHVHTIKIQTKIDAYGWLWMTMDDGWFMDDYGCLWWFIVLLPLHYWVSPWRCHADALDAAATAAAA